MKRDEVFAGTAARASDFEFSAQVAEVFDDMLLRSVPFYLEQQSMIKEIAKKLFIPGTNVYDLGCSTGTTLVNLGQEIELKASQMIGYDNSEPMLKKARETIKQHGLDNHIQILYQDLNKDVPLENASVVTMCWTLQFIRPLQRERLLKRICDGLVENGALLVTEKVLTNNTQMNRLFIELYYDFKRRNTYMEEEIVRKREALENVLIPYRTDENIEQFRRCGFSTVETFFQWYNFTGFLCVKTQGDKEV